MKTYTTGLLSLIFGWFIFSLLTAFNSIIVIYIIMYTLGFYIAQKNPKE